MASIHTKIALKNHHPHPSTSLEWRPQTLALTLHPFFYIIKLFSLNFSNLLVIYTRPFSTPLLHHVPYGHPSKLYDGQQETQKQVICFPKRTQKMKTWHYLVAKHYFKILTRELIRNGFFRYFFVWVWRDDFLSMKQTYLKSMIMKRRKEKCVNT